MAVAVHSRRRSIVRPSLLVVLGGLAVSITAHFALASGSSTVRVPDVVNLTLDRAQHQLESIGLEVATDGPAQSPLHPQDWTVVAQSAAPGTAVADGGQILLSIDLTPLDSSESTPSTAGATEPEALAGLDRPLGWVQQHYRGVDWLAVLVRTEQHDPDLWVHTGLPYDAVAAESARAVCNAFAAYQILELGGLHGVVVLSADGQGLASRLAGDNTCAASLG